MKKRTSTNILSFGTSFVRNRGSAFVMAFSSIFPVYLSLFLQILYFLRSMNLCCSIELQFLFFHAEWFLLFFSWHVPISFELRLKTGHHNGNWDYWIEAKQQYAFRFETKPGPILTHFYQWHFLRGYGPILIASFMNSIVSINGIKGNHHTCRRLRLVWFVPLSTLLRI